MWFSRMLSDQNGNESSKRMIAFLAFLQVLVLANRQAFGKDVVINQDIWWGMIILVCSGLGLSAMEFFSKRLEKKD